MKLTGILSAYCVCCAVALSAYADADFDKASKLLTAAKNANIQQVQSLISSGANVNYVDSTGLSLVCTALMNNDTRAFQILQMYGADASQCDIQIKQYKNKTTVKESGGVFGGLSSPQTLTLAAGGVALVGGGVALVAGAFNPHNNNGTTGGGSRPDSGGGGESGDNLDPAFTIPYGPAMPTSEAETELYNENLNLYSSKIETDHGEIDYTRAYELMNDTQQNYLLMMHGYSPFARGYLGQRTLRDTTTNKPLILSGDIYLETYSVSGGRPINVSLVTSNGINIKAQNNGSSLADDFILWTTINGTSINSASNIMMSSKYYNNIIKLGGNEPNDKIIGDDTIEEDDSLVGFFDLSGSGTAVKNNDATEYDNLLGKIVIGRTPFGDEDDFIGFMPNGQLTVFRTGGGKNNKGEPIDYMNYKALNSSVALYKKGDLNYSSSIPENLGRSRPIVFANASVIEPLHSTDAKTIKDVLMYKYADEDKNGENDRITGFKSLIDSVYDLNKKDGGFDGEKYKDLLPSDDADSFFRGLGPDYEPIVIFSTGASSLSDEKDATVKAATFENAAPLVYVNLNHLFMSVVPVALTGTNKGTVVANDKKISEFVTEDKYYLSGWQKHNDDEKDNYYRGRYYGFDSAIEQQAKSLGVDPWGFAAAGQTDEMAVAAAAGAVGVLKSAFNYLDNKKIFTLLALTADGPYLGYDDAGNKYTKETLASYLQNMFVLPSLYTNALTADEYLRNFQTVYGYGLINLERATTPGKSIYYYDPDKKEIVAGNGTAYWRAAANTSFNLTGPFGARGATISAPFYDVLTSIDGEMSLPRVWENEISLGSDSVHALYMGDVLGDLKTRKDSVQKTKIGNISLSMAISERPYADNLGGLDNLGFAYENDRFNLSANFQRYFTDGQSRFTGMANPILSLSANTISTGADYKFGNFFVGGRAFSGNITDEAFLQNDPTISSQYQSLSLGVAQGAMSQFGWNNKKFALVGSVGFMHESNTVLGAQTNGLLGIGNGNTTYFDMLAKYDVTDNVSLSLRSTFAQTKTNPTGMFINGVSDLNSNAFAFGANLGNFEFTVSRPLAIHSGVLRYAYADYNIIDNGNGKYDLVVSGAGLRDLSLAPDVRETRFSGTYRHSFGEFTDGALGFIYRVNPNNTNQFGNESIFMLKLTHRLGI